MIKRILLVLLCLLPTVTQGYYYYDDYEKYDKVIKINTFSEKLSYYENWKQIWVFDISSWDFENQTPAGRFRIMTKHEFMYSKSAGKWMPHWLEFYNWAYGIHWVATNYRWEAYNSSEEVIWSSAAWGCVRVWDENILKLYNWADYGTVVLIAYDTQEYNNEGKWEEVIKKYFWLINEWDYSSAFNIDPTSKLGNSDEGTFS